MITHTMFPEDVIRELFEYYQKEHNVLSLEEFKEDVMRFTYIIRLFKRYDAGHELNYRLLINHIIILYNVFGTRTTELLINYCPANYKSKVYALLEIIERLDEKYFVQIDNTVYRILEEKIYGNPSNIQYS